MPFLTGGNRRRRRRYKILKERKQGGCMWLVRVGVGWSGQGLERDGWVELWLAVVGRGWWWAGGGQCWWWGAHPGTLPDTRLADKDPSDTS